MSKTLFVRALLIGSTLALPAAAGTGEWTRIGPAGPEIVDVAIPRSDPVMYAVTASGTVYRSSTTGPLAWIAMGGFPVRHRRELSEPREVTIHLEVDPRNASSLYAALGNGCCWMTLYRSSDAGKTWVASAGATWNPRTLAVNRQGHIFASTNLGLYVSRDEGVSWSQSVNHRIASIVIMPNDDIFAAGPDGVHWSNSGGLDWTTRQTIRVRSLIRSASGDRMYALLESPRRVAWSSDGFLTWKLVSDLPADATAIALSEPDARLHATTVAGSFTLDTGSGGWMRIAGDGPIAGTLLAAGPDQRLVAAAANGIFERPMFPLTHEWRSANDGIDEHAPVRSVTVGWRGDLHIATAAGVFSSVNRGASWRMSTGITRPEWVASGSDATLVAAQSGIHRTRDEGRTWERLSQTSASWIGVPSDSASSMYAFGSEALRRSSDGGRSWMNVTPPTGWGTYASYAAVEPGKSQRVYFSYAYGFARTDDHGDTWSELHESSTISAVAAAPGSLHIAQRCGTPWGAPTADCGVESSLDDGETWSARRLEGEDVLTLVVDPSRPWRVYAGTIRGRVYRSEDYGNQWKLLADGLPDVPVYQLAIDRDGARLYAATAAGVYVYDDVPGELLGIERLPADADRLPRLMDAVLASQNSNGFRGALLIPVAGTVSGSRGMTFHTDVTLANDTAEDQNVIVAWLPQGNTSGSSVSTFSMSLPGSDGGGSGVLTLDSFAETLDVEGLGSLLVIAVDEAGNVDPDAEIDGFARIRSLSDCGGWMSQSLAAVPAGAFETGAGSRIIGLRHDATTRTNVGIVNLGATSRKFTVVSSGETANGQHSVTIAPWSPLLFPIPEGNYGPLHISVRAGEGSQPWVTLGSSVDNTSGDAWSATGN